MESWAIGWLVLLSVWAFVTMGYDKRQAVHHKWRVPERRLWLLAIAGGGIGAYFGMQAFRHKTKHTGFRVGFLVLALLDVTLLLYLLGVRLPAVTGLS